MICLDNVIKRVIHVNLILSHYMSKEIEEYNYV